METFFNGALALRDFAGVFETEVFLITVTFLLAFVFFVSIFENNKATAKTNRFEQSIRDLKNKD